MARGRGKASAVCARTFLVLLNVVFMVSKSQEGTESYTLAYTAFVPLRQQSIRKYSWEGTIHE